MSIVKASMDKTQSGSDRNVHRQGSDGQNLVGSDRNVHRQGSDGQNLVGKR